MIKTSRGDQGFTRIDLLVLAAMVLALGLLVLGIKKHRAHAADAPIASSSTSMANVKAGKIDGTRTPEQAEKLAQCASDLKQLGMAMAMYAQDNDERLPYAYITFRGYIAWDSLLKPFVARTGGGDAAGVINAKSLAEQGKEVFLCPADTIPPSKLKRLRRSFSMPAHNMAPADWPVGPTSSSGVGLSWSDHAKGIGASTNLFLPASGADTPFTIKTAQAAGPIPAVRMSMIPAPDRTLLLTEQANSNNILWDYHGAVVRSAHEQLDENSLSMDRYHQGQFNYLMVDAHVETLFPAQSAGKEDAVGLRGVDHVGNVWTIRPDD
jgi:prepilin-type processing-associated H-X9-DG protein